MLGINPFDQPDVESAKGLFIQLTADMPEDLPVPDTSEGRSSDITFGILKTAQALGDRRALMNAGRRVIRLHLSRHAVEDIRKLLSL